MKNEKRTKELKEMTNEEYRVELQRIFAGVDNNMLLQYFYLTALKKTEPKNLIDYQVSVPDYGDLIIEMVGKIDSKLTLEYIYCILNSYLRGGN